MPTLKKVTFTLFGLAVVAFQGCATTPNNVPLSIVLLGEIHDSPDGHRQRFKYLSSLVDNGWRPAIAMEQFDREHQDLLTKAQSNCKDANCVIDTVGRSKWDWQYYSPIIDLALKFQLPLIAANLSRREASFVIRLGFGAIFDSVTVARFNLDRPTPTDLLAVQSKSIITGHCNMLPESMVPGMVNAQIARDVWMAKVLLDNSGNGVVLIAGNGHVRRDVGVVRWLPAAQAQSAQIHGYVEPDSLGGSALYDFEHRVSPHQRLDPCASFVTPRPKS
jgi:uncharacterized iron-regulated protein